MFTTKDLRHTRVYQDAFQDGFQEGLQEGFKQGFKDGFLEGLKENLQEFKIRLIPIFFKYRLTPEQIARELTLDLEIVNQYIESQNNESE